MIEAKELRIGNWVNVKYLDYIDQIESITRNGVEGERYPGFLDLDRTEGIPLTSEILDKCGFAYKDGPDESGHYFLAGVFIFKHDELDEFYHDSLGPFKGTRVEIKHLHQLQNLYFALTGNELEVTLQQSKSPQ